MVLDTSLSLYIYIHMCHVKVSLHQFGIYIYIYTYEVFLISAITNTWNWTSLYCDNSTDVSPHGCGSEDFGNDVKLTVDGVLCLAKVRDDENLRLLKTKVGELRSEAKFRGLSVKANTRKPECVEMLLRYRCHTLRWSCWMLPHPAHILEDSNGL